MQELRKYRIEKPQDLAGMVIHADNVLEALTILDNLAGQLPGRSLVHVPDQDQECLF